MRWSPRGKHDLQLGMTGLPVRYDVSFNGEQQLSANTFAHCHVAAPRSGRLLGMHNHVAVQCARIAAEEENVNLRSIYCLKGSTKGWIQTDWRKSTSRWTCLVYNTVPVSNTTAGPSSSR